ncbi:hypothetical protein [Bacillus phage CM1]|nr:hypothetical protein Z3_38 [Bacillus phage Z3]BEU14745.1 hypothetical protein [Bacillus phage CM1]
MITRYTGLWYGLGFIITIFTIVGIWFTWTQVPNGRLVVVFGSLSMIGISYIATCMMDDN